MDQWTKDCWHSITWQHRARILGAPWSWLPKVVAWTHWNLLGGEIRCLRRENRGLRGDCVYLDETNQQLSADVATLLAGYHRQVSQLAREWFEFPSRGELCGARLYLGGSHREDRLLVNIASFRYGLDMALISPAYIDRYVGDALKIDIIETIKDRVGEEVDRELSKAFANWTEHRMKARLL